MSANWRSSRACSTERHSYAVHHEHIGALYPGVSLLGSRVMVAEGEKQRAEILLSRLALQIREATEETE